MIKLSWEVTWLTNRRSLIPVYSQSGLRLSLRSGAAIFSDSAKWLDIDNPHTKYLNKNNFRNNWHIDLLQYCSVKLLLVKRVPLPNSVIFPLVSFRVSVLCLCVKCNKWLRFVICHNEENSYTIMKNRINALVRHSLGGSPPPQHWVGVTGLMPDPIP